MGTNKSAPLAIYLRLYSFNISFMLLEYISHIFIYVDNVTDSGCAVVSLYHTNDILDSHVR